MFEHITLDIILLLMLYTVGATVSAVACVYLLLRTGQSVKDWIAEQEKSAFYAKQVDEEMDKLWESGQFDQKKLDELRGQHLRTPYK